MVRIICRIKPPKEDNIKIISENTIQLSKKSKDLLNNSIVMPYEFKLDKFYDHDVQTFDIYENEIEKKLDKDFSLFIYGHSGSGKTYTLFGNNKSRGIFDLLSEKLEYDYKLEALNLCHDGNFDLFDKDNVKLSIYSDSNNDLFYNCIKKQITIDNFEEVKDNILYSRTNGTSKYNKESSRSHLILKIYSKGRVYTIIDLAGNERKPIFKNKINELETSFINSSLLALKECFRSYGKKYMPYRRSDLTRFLKDIITSKNNLIVCTVHSGFPYFYDSIDTLNYVSSLLTKIKQKPNFYSRQILPKIDYSKMPKKSRKSNNRIKSPKDLFKNKNNFAPICEAYSPKIIKSSFNSDSDSLSQGSRKDSKDSISSSSDTELKLENDDLDTDLNFLEKKINKIEEMINKTKEMSKVLDAEINDFEDDEINKFEDELLDDYDDDDFVDEIDFIENELNKENENPDDELDPLIVKKLEDNFSDLIIPLIGKKNDIKNNIIIKEREIEFNKKILGIINNMIYKRSISNYGLLLEDGFNLSDVYTIKKNTIATLQACIDELKKM